MLFATPNAGSNFSRLIFGPSQMPSKLVRFCWRPVPPVSLTSSRAVCIPGIESLMFVKSFAVLWQQLDTIGSPAAWRHVLPGCRARPPCAWGILFRGMQGLFTPSLGKHLWLCCPLKARDSLGHTHLEESRWPWSQRSLVRSRVRGPVIHLAEGSALELSELSSHGQWVVRL